MKEDIVKPRAGVLFRLGTLLDRGGFVYNKQLKINLLNYLQILLHTVENYFSLFAKLLRVIKLYHHRLCTKYVKEPQLSCLF